MLEHIESALTLTVGNRQVNITPKQLERFWTHVKRGEPNDCWLWTGYLSPLGYGHTTLGKMWLSAHRLSWLILFHNIPLGLCVLHDCPGGDNPSCVNPFHLWTGTKRDNTLDMIFKGRGGFQRNPGKFNHAIGEDVPWSILTEPDVRTIRVRRQAGDTWRSIAESYAVSITTARCAGLGISWPHVI